ncbi:hypothetical protein FB2170_06160 [Maribacter sp. HTCC2170]|nr:hypothetical protein FB2170_06160 [Maribacter sp. HTCC2170]
MAKQPRYFLHYICTSERAGSNSIELSHGKIEFNFS